ncbi:MAG: hypothetical protein ACFE8B_12550, partial [Candidatus Hermodarchaeota archaeon]
MVKVPIGKVVKVDLWDSKKRRGMIKYNTNTMDLVRAESEFDLKKGDLAIVIESHDSFVLVVPKDKYTNLLKGDSLKHIDIKRLADMIFTILKEREEETGGILSFEELFSIMKRTSIQDIITKKQLIRALKQNNTRFDRIKEERATYLVLKAIDCTFDETAILKLAEEYNYLTVDIIQRETNWSIIRIKRILAYFLENNRCRIDTSYLTGH